MRYAKYRWPVVTLFALMGKIGDELRRAVDTITSKLPFEVLYAAGRAAFAPRPFERPATSQLSFSQLVLYSYFRTLIGK